MKVGPLAILLILPLAGSAVCWLGRTRRFLEVANLIVFSGSFLVAGNLAREVVKAGVIQEWHGALHADALSVLVALLTAFVALVSTIYAVSYFRDDERKGKITFVQLRLYYAMTPLFVGSMFLVVLANNLGLMWIALEITTLASVFLTAFYNQKTSLEAAWKYIIIGSVGISLALFGTILAFYSAAKLTGAESLDGLNWSFLSDHASELDPKAMKLAFILILMGYGTKAGIAPMHTWKPDVYSETPVPSAALLAAAVLNCALYGILRFHILASNCLGVDFSSSLLVFFGLGSMVIAAPFILVQRNFRRLLAYSSIDHTGIIIAALGFGGKLGALGAMLHMTFHAITKPLLFFCAGNIQQRYNTASFRGVTVGVIHRLPVTAVLFLLSTLAVTGVPPFSIFQSEFTVLMAATTGGRPWCAAIFIVCVVTIFSGFLFHMARLNLGPKPAMAETTGDPHDSKTWAIVLAAIPVCILGFWLPPSLLQLIEQAAQIIQVGS